MVSSIVLVSKFGLVGVAIGTILAMSYNLNDYYDVSIKKWRLKQIEKVAQEHQESIWTFIKGNIADKNVIDNIFENYKPSIVVNLAAQAENLLDFVDILQQELIRAKVLPEDYDFEGHKKLVPMQPGDVPVTYADTSALEKDFGFKPGTSLREGLRQFAEWYKEFYQVQ